MSGVRVDRSDTQKKRVETGKEGGVSKATTPRGTVIQEVALTGMVDDVYCDMVELEGEYICVAEGTSNYITGGRYMISPTRGGGIVAVVLGST